MGNVKKIDDEPMSEGPSQRSTQRESVTKSSALEEATESSTNRS